MKCPRSGCNNDIEPDPIFGVLPCNECQAKDSGVNTRSRFQFAKISKLHRVQDQRDKHGADLLQPYDGNKINPDFFRVYPEQTDQYEGAREELSKL